MKKSAFLLLSLFIYFLSFAQKNGDGMFISFGAQQFYPTRTGNANYIKALADSMHINGILKEKGGFGIGMNLTIRKKNTEFELGGFSNYSTAKGPQGNDQGYIKSNDIDLHMGVNYLVGGFWLLGTSILSNSETNSLKNFSSTAFTSGPTTNWNIFRGYSIGMKVQTGININLADDHSGYLRITGFYNLGLTKYDYMKSTDFYLKNYNNSSKTSIKGYGLALSILIRIVKPT